MLDTLKEMIANQYEASLCTLAACVDRCPDSHWRMPIGIYEFSLVAFHTLFFADLYLGPDVASLRGQAFHLKNKLFFDDYEQLEERKPVGVYQRSALQKYMRHCRKKAVDVIASETAESLRGDSGFDHRDFCRAELHVYNIRHIQHHSAQLILRLRTQAGVDLPWFASA